VTILCNPLQVFVIKGDKVVMHLGGGEGGWGGSDEANGEKDDKRENDLGKRKGGGEEKEVGGRLGPDGTKKEEGTEGMNELENGGVGENMQVGLRGEEGQ